MKPTATSSITMSFMNEGTWSHPGARREPGSNHRFFCPERFWERRYATTCSWGRLASGACSRFSTSRSLPNRDGIRYGWANNQMSWQHLSISRFGGPEVLQMVEESAIPEPGPGEARIKVLAAGTGFTDTMIRRGRYPDFKGPLPFTPGYEIVGVVERCGPGAPASL